MTKPSAITEPGWYWAEERFDEQSDGEGGKYDLAVLQAAEANGGGLGFMTTDCCIYDAAAADSWFRIIRRIEEPEVRGGWA